MNTIQQEDSLEETETSSNREPLNLEGQTIEVESKYDEVHNTPSHHVEFRIDETLPGRVFETVEAGISLDLYKGDIPTENLGVELVVTDSETNNVSTVALDSSETDRTGVCHFSGNFKSEDSKPKKFVLEFIKYKTLASKFELGLSSWL